MPKRVRINEGHTGITLPDGRVYDGPDQTVLSDEHADAIAPELLEEAVTILGGRVGKGLLKVEERRREEQATPNG